MLYSALLPEFSCQRSVTDSVARTGRFQKHPKKTLIGVSTLTRSHPESVALNQEPGARFRPD